MMDCMLKLEELPDDILLMILKNLDMKSKLVMSEVSKKFYDLIGDSSELLDDIILEVNLFELCSDSSLLPALSNSGRKYKKCIVTNHMIDRPLLRFIENQINQSLKVAEFRNLRLNLDAFILILDALPNLEEIYFQNIQILGSSKNKLATPKENLKELILDKTIHDDLKFLHSWTNVKILKIQYFNTIYNDIIFAQTQLQHLEIVGFKDKWEKLSKFQLNYLKVFFVEPSDDFVGFLNAQNHLESLELRTKFEFKKDQFRKFLTCILSKSSLLYLTLSLQEIPELSDLSFFYEFKSNLKNLAINTYGNNNANFIANFVGSTANLEYLHLISEPESQTEEIAFSINQLEKMEYLNIDRCGGDFMKQLILKSVYKVKIETFIGNCEDCVEFLRNNKKIREFRFLTSFLGDGIVKTIVELEELEVLEILLEDPILGMNYLISKCRNLKTLKIYKDEDADNPDYSADVIELIDHNDYRIIDEVGLIHLERK